jgi:hypothetical protein
MLAPLRTAKGLAAFPKVSEEPADADCDQDRLQRPLPDEGLDGVLGLLHLVAPALNVLGCVFSHLPEILLDSIAGDVAHFLKIDR